MSVFVICTLDHHFPQFYNAAQQKDKVKKNDLKKVQTRHGALTLITSPD